MSGGVTPVQPPTPEVLYALARTALALGELADAIGLPERLESAAAFLVDGELDGPDGRTFAAVLRALASLQAASRPAFGPETLTRREREVLALLAEGLTDQQIAARLCVSPHTAGTHVKHVRAKLGGGSRAAVVARAINAGIFLTRARPMPPIHRSGNGNGNGTRLPSGSPVGAKR